MNPTSLGCTGGVTKLGRVTWCAVAMDDVLVSI
jgi:hypothetical protein